MKERYRKCNEMRDVSKGLECERGHFICSICAKAKYFGGFSKKICPVCDSPLR